MSDITQEQAIKIVEWLGEEVGSHGMLWRTLELPVTCVEYLSSPPGQVVMMDRLKEKLGYGLRIEFNVVIGGKWTCYISKHIDSKEWGGFGATITNALINAILEMLKDDKN